MLSILGPIYLRNRQEFRHPPEVNPMFAPGKRKAEQSFQLFGLLGYAGTRSVFHWQKECDLSLLNSGRMDKILAHRPYLTYQLEKLGYRGKFPENEAELKQLQTALRDQAVLQNESYFGLIPLFHRESSPTEQTFRLLVCFPYYRNVANREQKLHFLGICRFQKQQLRAWEASPIVERTSVFALPLLGDVVRTKQYAASPEWETVRQLFAASRAAGNRIDREEVRAELRKINPKLDLPESVTDGESLRAFLTDAIPACRLPVQTTWSGGCLPLLCKQDGTWFSLALLSIYSRSKEESTFLSIPLLTYVKDSAMEKDRFFLFPVGWMASRKQHDRDAALVCEADEVLDHRSFVHQSGLGVLLGLYHQEDETVLVAVKPGEAARLNRLRTLLRTRIHDLRQLAELEMRLHVQRPIVEQTLKAETGKTFVLDHEDACRKTVSAVPKGYLQTMLEKLKWDYNRLEKQRAMLLSSQKRLSEVSVELGLAIATSDMNSAEVLQTCLNSLYSERIREAVVRENGTWFFDIRRVGADSRWNVAWILADGFTSEDREEVHILRYLYRYRRDGEKSETLLPFFSLQRNGEDRRVSFFWRLWERRTVNGKTSGHFCFIPFGDSE